MNESPLPYQVFESVSNRRVRAYISIAAGVLMVAVAIGAFVFSLRTSPSLIAFHAMTTMPMILAVALFASAYPALRSATRIIVGEQELIVFRGPSELGHWPWEQIALASTAQSAGHKQLLKLYGQDGKRLITLSDDLEAFDAMVNQIKLRMTRQPSPHRSSVAQRKGRRKGILMMLGGILFLALAAANAWMAFHDRESRDLLRTRGQPAQAVVVRKFTAPNGHTRRIEYRVDAPGAPLENVEVEPRRWVTIQEHQVIPVITVPERPDISRLYAGQVDDRMQADPNMMLGVSAGIAIMAILAILAGGLNLKGWDLKWDKVRHRPRFMQFGEE